MGKKDKSMLKSGFILSSLCTIVFFPVLTLFLAGNWLWLEGWIFSLWIVAMILSSTVYMYRHDPALLAERSKLPGSDNQKGWDRYFLSVLYLMAMGWFIIMPLDAERFRWSPDFSVGLKVLGGLALLPSLHFIYRATVENTYLSTMVRIQAERGQHVISTGVYGIVRHPLYFGCLLMCMGAPLLLGSICGLIISSVTLIVLIGRIMGEEKMLLHELDGYEDYMKKVKYRLIPYIW